MRVDHGRDRQVLDLLVDQLEARPCRLERRQRVEDDPAGFAADEGEVGEIQAANLVDPRDDLEQSVLLVEARLPQQGRVDAVEVMIGVEPLVPLDVPGRVPRVSLYDH